MAAPTSVTYKSRRIIKHELLVSDGAATPALVPIEINSKGVTLDPTVQEFITQDTTQQYIDREVQRMRATIANDVLQEAIYDLAWANSTTSLGANVAKEWYFTGLPDSVALGYRVTVRAIDLSSLTPTYFYWYFPKASIVDATPVGSYQSGGTSPIETTTILEFSKTSVDALGTALSPAPPEDVYALIQKLTAAP